MTVNHAAGVIPALVIHLILDVKVHHANDAVRREQGGDGVDHGVELRNHGQSIAHGDELGTTGIRVLIEVAHIRLAQGHFLASVGFTFVLMETEGSGVLADDLDVLPAKAFEAVAGNFAQAGGEIHDICGR